MCSLQNLLPNFSDKFCEAKIHSSLNIRVLTALIFECTTSTKSLKNETKYLSADEILATEVHFPKSELNLRLRLSINESNMHIHCSIH